MYLVVAKPFFHHHERVKREREPWGGKLKVLTKQAGCVYLLGCVSVRARACVCECVRVCLWSTITAFVHMCLFIYRKKVVTVFLIRMLRPNGKALNSLVGGGFSLHRLWPLCPKYCISCKSTAFAAVFSGDTNLTGFCLNSLEFSALDGRRFMPSDRISNLILYSSGGRWASLRFSRLPLRSSLWLLRQSCYGNERTRNL